MIKNETIMLGHGSGGRQTQELLACHFMPAFSNPILDTMQDSGVINDLAFTTDSFVVTPRFFAGGDIGKLAICGTLNDLSMVGANVIGLTAAFILAEGLPLSELDLIITSMAREAHAIGVDIVAGDTKVVPHDACDGIFITTSAVGRIDANFRPQPRDIKVGDAVIVSGTIGDHGMAVMTARPGMPFSKPITSDVATLAPLVEILRQANIAVHALRDPTRGGLAQSLIELSQAAQVQIELQETVIPVTPEVLAACELLGLDPLYVANEGKLIAIVPESQAAATLTALRAHPLGRDAVQIGTVTSGDSSIELRTKAGGRRSLRMASGELLPRIC
ncbi:MAG: hydrogenase expression/formation protein HypE [Deltaproteobacteria bacterium]|nr:hydrogenase expression/formation protein HypE [Deltaproteobacteria bacterium]